ncbi:TPA: glycosyltransferase family 8 protein [Mannheimia haemolytica]
MNIVLSSDENYAPYLAVSILSVLEYNHNVHFYILDLGISNISKDRIINLVNENNANIDFILVKEEDFLAFPKTIKHISIATYARLKLDEYLPNLDKILYLDVDTLTTNSLSELWNIDLYDFSIGACYDSFIETNGYKLTIGLSEHHHYFNAGVLLINMYKFKNSNVYHSALQYLEKYQDIKYQDQDIMNFIFKDDVIFINPKYNFMPTLKNKIRNKVALSELERLSTPISIIHYCSEVKAWHKKCSHTNSNLFLTLFNSIKNKPSSWIGKVEKVSCLKKISRIRKDMRNKIIYGIK